jgi:hypothetical protein
MCGVSVVKCHVRKVHPLLFKNDISLINLPGMQYILVIVTGNYHNCTSAHTLPLTWQYVTV